MVVVLIRIDLCRVGGARQPAHRSDRDRRRLTIIAISVALFDAVVALPLLLVLLAVGDDLSPMVLLLPIVFAVQFVLMSGLAWLTASISVFLRDVPNIINVLVLLGFYLTPVYFSVTRVPQQYRWVVQLNPAAILIEADRAYRLGQRWPSVEAMVSVGVGSLSVAAVGYLCFRSLSPAFADEL